VPTQVQSGGLPVWWTTREIVQLLLSAGCAEIIAWQDGMPARIRLVAACPGRLSGLCPRDAERTGTTAGPSSAQAVGGVAPRLLGDEDDPAHPCTTCTLAQPAVA
jgi:hypothetical protein